MLITVLNLDFESVWSLAVNFTFKVLGSKWLFSEFSSKIETLISANLSLAERCDICQMNAFFIHFML